MSAKFKIEPGIKLKALPLEKKVALRLISLAERRQNTAQFQTLSEELGAASPEVMAALDALFRSEIIDIGVIDANGFAFVVKNEVRKTCKKDAKNFHRHLEARTANPSKPLPARPPITDEQRQLWMEKGKLFAESLAEPRIVSNLAACIARIGLSEVETLVQTVIDDKREAPARATKFFRLYTKRRNVLCPLCRDE